MTRPSFFSELKRRNVLKASAAYLALGWVVTQITATVAPMLNLPAWIGPVVLWIGIIGFPFVVMFSWVYEITPEGIRRESEVERDTSITHITARRLDFVCTLLFRKTLRQGSMHIFGKPTERLPIHHI